MQRNSVTAFLAHVGLSEHSQQLDDLGVQTLQDLIDTFTESDLADMGLPPDFLELARTWAVKGDKMARGQSGKFATMHSQLSSVLDSSGSSRTESSGTSPAPPREEQIPQGRPPKKQKEQEQEQHVALLTRAAAPGRKPSTKRSITRRKQSADTATAEAPEPLAIPEVAPPALAHSRKSSPTQLGAWLAAVGEAPLESALQDLGIERLQDLKELGETDLEALGLPDSLWRALTGPDVEVTRDVDGNWSVSGDAPAAPAVPAPTAPTAPTAPAPAAAGEAALAQSARASARDRGFTDASDAPPRFGASDFFSTRSSIDANETTMSPTAPTPAPAPAPAPADDAKARAEARRARLRQSSAEAASRLTPAPAPAPAPAPSVPAAEVPMPAPPVEAIVAAPVVAAAAAPPPTAATIQLQATTIDLGSDDVMRYCLAFAMGGRQWAVRHRYSEFSSLRSALGAAARRIVAPFPPKVLTSWINGALCCNNKHDPVVVEHRALALQAWLTEALALDGVLRSPAVREFLASPPELGLIAGSTTS